MSPKPQPGTLEYEIWLETEGDDAPPEPDAIDLPPEPPQPTQPLFKLFVHCPGRVSANGLLAACLNEWLGSHRNVEIHYEPWSGRPEVDNELEEFAGRRGWSVITWPDEKIRALQAQGGRGRGQPKKHWTDADWIRWRLTFAKPDAFLALMRQNALDHDWLLVHLAVFKGIPGRVYVLPNQEP